MTVSSKVRIYDLAKELKLDTKRLIEEVRREGVDVSVPSNSVSKELAEKLRNKYSPKKETAIKRTVTVVKRAVLPEAPATEAELEVQEPEPDVVDAPQPAPEPVEAPPVDLPPAAKQPIPARLVKKLTPAARAEAPTPEAIEEEAPVVKAEPAPVVEAPVFHEPVAAPIEATAAPRNGLEVKTPPPPAPAPPPPPPSRQVRVLRPTAAALNAGIRPGERAPAPAPPPPPPSKERAGGAPDRPSRLRERPSLPRNERMGTPGET